MVTYVFSNFFRSIFFLFKIFFCASNVSAILALTSGLLESIVPAFGLSIHEKMLHVSSFIGIYYRIKPNMILQTELSSYSAFMNTYRLLLPLVGRKGYSGCLQQSLLVSYLQFLSYHLDVRRQNLH